MKIKINKKLNADRKAHLDIKSKKFEQGKRVGLVRGISSLNERLAGETNLTSKRKKTHHWNFVYAFVLLFAVFSVVIVTLFQVQVVKGAEYQKQSQENQLQGREIYPNRGAILDKFGVPIAENIPSYKVFVNLKNYRNEGKIIEPEKIKPVADELQKILGENWQDYSLKKEEQYETLADRIVARSKEFSYINDLLVAWGVDNDIAIKIKAATDILPGVYVDQSTKRVYNSAEAFSQIVGYVGVASKVDIESKDYIKMNDVVGKTGVESYYDEQLIGVKGSVAVETNRYGIVVSEAKLVLEEPEDGKTLYLTIDKKQQDRLYKILKNGAKQFGARSATGIIMDVNTGEIVAMSSYPGYDTNAFIRGVTQAEYTALVENPGKPLFNKLIAAQEPPGSIFKTLVAASALDAGEITTSTKYVSKSDYKFSNGQGFWDYGHKAWGVLNVKGALEVSSNIYFCEVIRNWDMNELVPYLVAFGVGDKTGIDIPGEQKGRVPSPENKINLANSGNTLLDPVWYAEGDSCNSVIGQGITLATPIQAVSWASTIANGGKVLTPHVGYKFVSANGTEEVLEYEAKRENIVSASALQTVREGMRQAVAGPRSYLGLFESLPFDVASKTGTAEFEQRINGRRVIGTHAWNIGFFPYQNPQYAYVFFLEDGGFGSNSAKLAKEFLQGFDLKK